MEGASQDLISMLPTIKFCKAAHQQQTQQKQQQQQEQDQQQQEKPAAVITTTAAPATEEGQAPTREKEVEPPASGEGAAVLAAPVAVVEGKALPVQAVEGAADGDGDGKGPDVPVAGPSACCAEIASAVSVVAVAEAASPPQQEQQQGKEAAEADADEVGSEHGDDLSCRVCFEDYEDGDGAFLFRLVCLLLARRLCSIVAIDSFSPERPLPPIETEQRVLPCFHRFHVACIDAWLARKKLCPLCNTSIDVILQPPDQFLAEQGTAVA